LIRLNEPVTTGLDTWRARRLLMADTAMLLGLLGWHSHAGKAEQLCD
jgi:hypothetical protein